MNKKLYYVASLVLATMVGLLAGCTKQGGEDWIKADKAAITLSAAGTDAVVISVEASTSWTATQSDAWIQLATESNTVTVTAPANEEVAERSGLITLTAGSAKMEISVVQVGREALTANYRFLTNMQSAGISPSGKYVACYAARVADDGNTLEFDLYRINLETNEQELIGSYAQSLYEFNFVRCVTDEGVIFMDRAQTYSVVFEEGKAEYMVEGFDGITSPRIEATSGDGSVWVGYGIGETGYTPVKYVNGVPERMEMPETNFRGEAVGNVTVRGCSLDGSMAYGSTWDNMDFGMVYWDAEGHVHYAGEDIYTVTPVDLVVNGNPMKYNLVTGMQVQADAFNMSPNGRYIGGTYFKEEANADKTDIVTTMLPAVYDTVEGKTIILSDYAGRGAVTAVDDNGIALVVATSGMALYSQTIMVDINTGENLGQTIDYVMDKFGIMLPSSHGVTYLPVGGNTAWGEEAAPGGNMLWFWYVVGK